MGKGDDDGSPGGEEHIGNRLGDRESDRSGLAIGLFVRGAQGRCDSLSTTQRFEQHDWLEL